MTRRGTHPGEVLQEEFLRPMGMSVATFARRSKIPAAQLRNLIAGSPLLPEQAARIAEVLGTSAEFWLDLQGQHDRRPQERLEAALQALLPLVGLDDLGRRVGLSRGYLGQCRPSAPHPRQPARSLVLLLEALVRHPEDLDLIAD